MADIKDDMLRKKLEGKISTSTELEAEEEQIRLQQDRFPTGTRRDLFNSPGDFRFVGNITEYALQSPTKPDNHPRRHRRLIQEHLIYGADVYAEGTAGEVTSGAPDRFDTGNVDVGQVISNAGLTATDLVLVISQVSTSDSPQIYSISSVTADEIFVDRPDDLPSTLSQYFWQVILPNPVQLLAYPDDTGDFGDETTFMTIKPSSWPTRRHDIDNGFVPNDVVMTVTNVEFTTDEKIRIVGEHSNGSSIYSAGDFVTPGDFGLYGGEGDDYFYVTQVESFTPGSPDQETIIVVPMHDVDITTLDIPEVTRVLSVGDRLPFDALDNLYEDEQDHAGGPLDAIRVKNLVGPSDVDPLYRRPCGIFLKDFSVSALGPGYLLTLYPADGSGNPSLSEPITDFENIVIDDSVDEEQSLFIDYDEGIIRLSHPIGSNSDLNPNGYTDSYGRARLFASFVAYNEKVSPAAAQELVYRNRWDVDEPGANAGRIRFSEGEGSDSTLLYNTPIENDKSWVFEFPAGDVAELYHRDPFDHTTKGGKEERMAVKGTGSSANERGVNQRYQFRNDLSGFYRLGAMFYGAGSGGDRTSRFVFYPDASDIATSYDADTETQVFGPDDQPDFRITYEQVFVDSFQESGYPIFSGGEEIRFVINDLEVTVTMSSGTPTASSLQSDIDTAITNAASALSVSAGTYSVTVENTGGDDFVRITAESSLYFHDGDAHGDLGFPTDQGIGSDGIRLQWGYDSAVVNTLSWDQNDNTLVFDGDDIALSTGESLKTSGSSSSTNAANIASNDTDIANLQSDLTTLESEYDGSASIISDLVSEGAIDAIPENGTFISIEGGLLGEIHGDGVLGAAADTIYGVAADGNGRFFVLYQDDSSGNRTLGRYALDTVPTGGGTLSAEESITVDATADIVQCNGPVVGVASDNSFDLYEAENLATTVGSYVTPDPATFILSFELRREEVYVLTEAGPASTGDQYDYTIQSHDGSLGGSATRSVDRDLKLEDGVAQNTTYFMTADENYIHVFAEDGGGVPITTAYEPSGGSSFAQVWTNSVGAATETVNAGYADGSSLYFFGDYNSGDTGAGQMLRVGRSTGAPETRTVFNPDDNDATAGDLGATDHRNLYLATGGNLYFIDKFNDSPVEYDTVTGGGSIVDVKSDGTLVYVAFQDTTDGVKIYYTGDRGGLYHKLVGKGPTYTWRSAIHNK